MGETDFDISQFFNGEKTIKNSFDGWLELNFKVIFLKIHKIIFF